jgi:hypothetical protein
MLARSVSTVLMHRYTVIAAPDCAPGRLLRTNAAASTVAYGTAEWREKATGWSSDEL